MVKDVTDDSQQHGPTRREVLGVPPATDRAAWEAIPATLIDPIVREASASLDEPWPTLPASEYLLYHRTGDRHRYEQRIWARRDRLTRAAIAAARTLEPRHIDDVIDGVWAWCEQSTWCWPAHDDHGGTPGRHLPDSDRPFLDLGAGEAVAQLALVDHLLGRELDRYAPGLRARIRREARLRVFEPLIERRDWPWLGSPDGADNWNPWIHSNILVAASALLTAPSRTRMVALVLEGLRNFLNGLPADGAVDEGYSYWWVGALRALEAAELLRRLSGGTVDLLTEYPSLRATIDFPRSLFIGPASVDASGHIESDWVVNAADGPARVTDALPWHSLYRTATRLEDAEAAAFAVAHRPARPRAALGLGRLVAHLCDDTWLGDPRVTVALDRDVWLGSIQTLVARERAGTATGLALAAKAGHNGEHHNHNDVGGFIVAVDGVPVIVDPGRTTYTAQTFGPDRYRHWALTSEWHNVPAVHGRPQRPGPEWAATEVAVTLARGPAEPTTLSSNLAGAYGSDPRVWTRTATLRRGHPAVEIEDHWCVDGVDPAAHVIRLIVAGRVDDLGDGTLRVTGPEGTTPLVVRFSGNGFTLERRHLEDPMLSHVWGESLIRVNILAPHEAGAHRIRIEPDTTDPHAGRRTAASRR